MRSYYSTDVKAPQTILTDPMTHMSEGLMMTTADHQAVILHHEADVITLDMIITLLTLILAAVTTIPAVIPILRDIKQHNLVIHKIGLLNS